MNTPFHSDTYKRKQDGPKLDTADLKALFLLMYEVHGGNRTDAARAANVHYDTPGTWRKKDEEFRQAMDQIRETTEEQMLDTAEHASGVLIRTLDGAQVRWYLDRKGRARGYGQVVKQKHGGEDGPRIQVDVEGDYPPRPASLVEWEEQQEESRQRRAAAKAAALADKTA